MTSTKMMFAVALLVVAAMIVAPAAARTGTVIGDGDTIFVYEDCLDISALGNGTTVTSLKMLDDTTILKSLPVGNDSCYNVPTLEGDDLGTYYAFNGSTNTERQVVIEEPTLKLGVVLADSHTSSVDGQSVAETTPIAFKITTDEVGIVLADDDYASVTVEVFKEGVPLTTFGDANLLGIYLTGSTMYTDDERDECDLTLEDPGDYTARAKWATPDGFKNDAPKSNTVSFTIRTKEVTIESDKDTVVRGNSFVVTVSGDSKAYYYVYVEKSGTIDEDEYPLIRADQTDVWVNDPDFPIDCADDAAYFDDTYAEIRTDAAGIKKVLFETSVMTDDKTFTIHVVNGDCADEDNVKVTIEKGAVTVVAEGDQSYFLGEEVTFSGTNTDSGDVYLFITGPNLASDGGYITDPMEDVWVDDEVPPDVIRDEWEDFDSVVSVDSNDEWDYDWDTADLDLDAGTYTIYACSAAADKGTLDDVEYDSVSIVIKKPFVTAGKTADVVAVGDDLTIAGTAEGDPDDVWVWVFGKNYFRKYEPSVEDDGTFEEDIKTDDLASGQYFVVIQHEMYNGRFDVEDDECDDATCAIDLITEEIIFVLDGKGSLQGSDAAQALTEALDSPYIDDTYTKLDFLVEEPWITIDSVGDKYVGDVFTLTGETNLAEGDELLVEVVSASFKPTEKTASGEFSGVSGTTEVVAGEDYNAWSFEVDASAFKPDEYIVRVESIDSGYTATTTFDVLAGAPPTTAPPTTAPPTTAPPTTAPPTTAEPTPTPTPGFGALIALIGLGAVAVLVVRKH